MDKSKEKKSQGKIQSLECTLGVQLGNLSLYILLFHSPNPAYITTDKQSPLEVLLAQDMKLALPLEKKKKKKKKRSLG
jgi:hypothetical protein